MRNNGNSDYSRLEQIINGVISQKNGLANLEFDSLNKNQRDAIISEITVNCKRNVVGAMYQNFDGIMYGYDLHGEGIWLNPVAYEFLLKHKFELEKLIYYAWAKKLEELNSDDVLVKLLDKLEDATPKRNDLSIYRKILMEEFEVNICFYCGKKLADNASVDHVIPWKLVREDRIWNFVLACKSCNSKKNDKIPDKKGILQVVSRNEDFICGQRNILIERECKEYSSELMLKLWNYAKVGGYQEYEYK